MVIAVRTEPGPEGLEIIKEATSDSDRIRLDREADLLRRAAHPGVVEVLGHEASTLRLRHQGTPLTHLLPLPGDHAAAVVCAVAEIVDALHDAGVAHGQIAADHVLIDDRGRPRLCGFGHAEAIDSPRAAAAATDSAGLGGLFEQLLDASRDLPWGPANRGARHRTHRKRAREAFRDAAAMATRDDPVQRISPRQLANAIRTALPTLELPSPPEVARTARGEITDQFEPIPRDISPTGDLRWTDRELDYLGTTDGDDLAVSTDTDPRPSRDTYADLAALGVDAALPDPAAPATGEPDVLNPPPYAPPPAPAREREAESPSTTPATEEPRPTSSRDIGSPAAPPVARKPEPSAVVGTAKAAEGAAGEVPSVLAPVRLRESAVPPRRRRQTGTLVLLAIALLAFGGAVGILVTQVIKPFGDDDNLAADSDDGVIGTGSPEGTASPGSGPDDTSASEPGSGASWPDECDVPRFAGPDLDDDGCPESIRLDGRIATVGNVQVELGIGGDLLTVGDTNCDGIATPFLLRPSTGEVFAFPEWAIDQAVEVTTMTVVDGATDITSSPAVDGCGDVITIETDDPEVEEGEVVVAGGP